MVTSTTMVTTPTTMDTSNPTPTFTTPTTMVTSASTPTLSAAFKFEVRLVHYRNEGSRAGRAQDRCKPISCVLLLACPCDNIFTFCLRPPGNDIDDDDLSNCPLGMSTTRSFDNNDNIDFGRITDNTYTITSSNRWPVS